MKKDISTKLNDIADNPPQIFEWETGIDVFPGEFLRLSALGDTQKFDDNKVYEMEVPVMRAVEHKQQVKDAYKRAGDEGVRQYVNEVVRKYRTYSNN